MLYFRPVVEFVSSSAARAYETCGAPCFEPRVALQGAPVVLAFASASQ